METNPLLVSVTTVMSMIESDDAILDGHALHELLPDLEQKLGPLLRPQTQDQLDFLILVASMLCNLKTQVGMPSRIRMLDSIAVAFFPLGQSVHGIPFSLQAARLAKSSFNLELERKALNTSAALANDAGIPSHGVDYAVQAVEIATRLEDRSATAASLANLTSSLKALGLYAECMSLSLRLFAICRNDANLRGYAAQAYGNLSMCVYVLGKFELGVKAADKAAEGIKAPSSAADVSNIVGSMGAALKCLVALKLPEEARLRLEKMKQLASAMPLPRLQLNVLLGEGLCEVAEGQLAVGVARLLHLLPKTSAAPGLYVDNLEALIRAYDSVGDSASMLRYSGQLVEHVMLRQTKSIQTYLQKVGLEQTTLQPGKQDVYPLVRAVAFEGRSPTPQENEAPVDPRILKDTLERMAVTAELPEDATGRHAYRVGTLVGLIAAEMGYGELHCRALEEAARLHDIGKIAVRGTILNKPGKLTPVEFSEMQRHTVLGDRLLSIHRADTALARQIALGHHEQWNGRGYPHGLLEDRIPEAARITSLADVYDALTHKRVYKHAWPMQEAIDYIRQQRGVMFDPRITDACLSVLTRLQRRHGDDLDAVLAPKVPSEFLRSNDKVQELVRSMPAPWETDLPDLAAQDR